ncbi:MAG: tetratricopeptide repeat protein [Myxococcota bacterium]
MSDFGFDTYALEDLGAAPSSHPLQVAGNLIATGKPRSALDVLAEHHARLADDPDYLMLCGQAWFAAGDAPRAQHAFLGAARVAPTDPRPLRLLGELLLDRGEEERAKRLFRKAARLGDPSSEPTASAVDDEPAPRSDDDLIAFAESKERTRRGPPPIRQWVLMGVTIGVLGLLMSAIASFASPDTRGVAEPASRVAPAPGALEPSLEGKPKPFESPDLPEVPELPGASTPAVSGDAVAPSVPVVPPGPTEITAALAEPDPDERAVEAPVVPTPEPVQAAAPTEAPAVAERWPDADASPLLAAPAPVSDWLVPTIEMPSQPVEAATVKAAPRRTSKRRAKATGTTKPRTEGRPAKPTTPAAPERDIEAELAKLASASAATQRGDALADQGELATAARFYRRALELDPDYAPALVAMGRSLLRAEKYGDAMRSATRALQLARGVDARPGLEAEALYQMGRVRHERGELDAARQLLRQSISMPRTPAEAWFYLGESLSRDNWPDARDAYEEYLGRRPNGHLSDRARRAIQ